MLKVIFCDTSLEFTYFLKKEFKLFPGVQVENKNIFDHKPVDAIVSPGNSFGLMDAGLDKLMCQRFGEELEIKLQTEIRNNYNGELLVGQAIIIPIKRADFHYFISAPTMRVPMKIQSTPNTYLATKGVFIAINQFNLMNESKINSVIIPGMGVGSGKMPYEVAAKQMRQAYEDQILNRYESPKDWRVAIKKHKELIS